MTPVERASRVLKETSGVRGQSGVHSRDIEFLEGLLLRKPHRLSEKQEKWLKDIETRAFGDDDE